MNTSLTSLGNERGLLNWRFISRIRKIWPCLVWVFQGFLVICPPQPVFSKDVTVERRYVLMWQVQKDVSDSDLALLAGKGVNLIQAFGIVNWNDDEIKTYLDKAEKHGMGVVFTMGGLFDKSKSELSFDSERAKVLIGKWKEHPASFAWHPFDEPSHEKAMIPPHFLKEIYGFLKAEDPVGTVMISWNGTSDKHYDCCFSEEAFDLLDLHAYVREIPGERQQRLIETFIKHRKKIYPVIITIRSFNGGRKKRIPLPANGLRLQYDFFFKKHKITDNIGFYGWGLGNYRGIKDDPDLLRQFKELNISNHLIKK